MFYCEEEKQDNFRDVIEAEKLGFLDFNFPEKGVAILNNGNSM